MTKEKECVCRDCKKHCYCELHEDYEKKECQHGKFPIDKCTMKE